MNSEEKIPEGYHGPNYKVCLLGDGGVGKSAIVERIKGQKFHSTYIITIGADISTYNVNVDGYTLTLQIWDLAGQNRFNVVRSLYYRGAHAAILVFDRTRPESLKSLITWREELFMNAGREVPFIVVGNKSDLPNRVEKDTINEFILSSQKFFAKIPHTIEYIETSAKTSVNIKKTFETIANTIKNYIESYSRQT